MSIDKTIAAIADHAEPVSTAELLRRALTLEGRIEWNDAVAALSGAERHACNCIISKEHIASPHTGNLSLAFRPRGRLYLIPRAEFEAQAEAFTLLCHVDLDEDDLQTYFVLRQSMRETLDRDRVEICADLSEQGFERVGKDLAFAAEHMAPLIYYVGEHCISNFYDIGKSDFTLEMTFADALQQVAEHRERAGIEALTVAHCLHLALCSGNYTRLEELNSSQLSRGALLEFFDQKWAFYEKINDRPAEERFEAASLRGKAALLARMRETIAAKKRFVRLINGPNLRKREAVLPLSPVSACDVLSPHAHVLSILQRFLPPGSSAQILSNPEHFERLLGENLIPKDKSPFFGSYLEYLIDQVVSEAVCSTNSDFGMTRSVRDYRRFAQVLHGQQTELACGWTQAEYFCHVVPSSNILGTFAPKVLIMTLNAISARMRFNTWHYIPSYFDFAAIPADRGWFTAPRMADIADDSDQHHNGHIHATVRHSIRSPLPLRVGREVLPGFIDLRLMRQSKNPYNEEELATAIAYTEALQFLYQILMNHVLEHNTAFVFSFGDKKWFDKMYSMQVAPIPHSESMSLLQQSPLRETSPERV